MFLQTTVPLVLFGYILVWLVAIWVNNYRLRMDQKREEKEGIEYSASRIGVKRISLNPEKEAKEMGFPSIYPKDKPRRFELESFETIPEIEQLLAEGKIEEALRLAGERYELAIACGDEKSKIAYRRYIDRIQRGEW